MSLLETECLKANSYWVAFDVISVQKALLDAAAGAVNLLRYEGGYPMVYSFDQWVQIDTGEGDEFIQSAHKKILVPRVAICVNYATVRAREIPFTSDNLLKRYGNKDAVTGKRLARQQMSREHVTPRSQGGKNGWENEVPMEKRLNSKRGNQPYEKVGLQPPTILPPPKPLLPIHLIRNRMGYPEWDLFLGKR